MDRLSTGGTYSLVSCRSKMKPACSFWSTCLISS
jgi:hypothetical protein